MDQREDAEVLVSMLCTRLLLVEDVVCLVDRRAGLITVGDSLRW